MSFVAVGVIGGMAAMGAIGGAMKSGPDANTYGRQEAGSAYDAYKNLVGKGPGEQDVTNSYNATRDYSTVVGNLANTGLYNSSEGNRLAEMQFAPQRQALAQSLQDQMAQANRAASAAGRSSNDPILRARLGAEQMRQSASLSAAQSSAAMDLGRQSTMDMLAMRGQQVNTLQGLASQAFSNQQNLFNMGSQIQQMDMGNAQYEQSRGGGWKGGLTGAITGAGAGMQMMTGFGGMGGGGAGGATGMGGMDSSSFTMPQLGSQYGKAPASIGQGWSGGMSSAPQFPSMPAARAPAFTTSSNYTTIPNYLAAYQPSAPSPLQTGQWYNLGR